MFEKATTATQEILRNEDSNLNINSVINFLIRGSEYLLCHGDECVDSFLFFYFFF